MLPKAMQPHQGISSPMCSTSNALWIRPLGDHPPNPISVKAGSAKLVDVTTSESVSTGVGTGGGEGISKNSLGNKIWLVIKCNLK